MELRQLRYFVALAEELNYRLAAERLRVSKPTLSQQLGALERSLGSRLLERDNRSVSLTPAGQALLLHARQVLTACDRLRLAVSTATYGSQPLQVRVVNGVQHVIGDGLDAVRSDAPLTVHLTMTSGLDAEEAVLSGRADAAVIWMPSGYHTTLHAEQLATAPVSLAVPERHPLARLDVVSLGDLIDERIALFPRAVAPRLWDRYVQQLLPAGPSPGQILEETTDLIPMMGMLKAVSDGRGVAPFVHDVGQAVALPGVTLRPLDPPLDLPVMLVCREPTRPELRRLAVLLRNPSSTGSGSS